MQTCWPSLQQVRRGILGGRLKPERSVSLFLWRWEAAGGRASDFIQPLLVSLLLADAELDSGVCLAREQ